MFSFYNRCATVLYLWFFLSVFLSCLCLFCLVCVCLSSALTISLSVVSVRLLFCSVTFCPACLCLTFDSCLVSAIRNMVVHLLISVGGNMLVLGLLPYF